MILAAAQTKPFKNNTDQNILEHLRLVELAAKEGAKLIVFPEMSLTGYERELADELSFSENDSRLSSLKEKAVSGQIIIVAGAPIKIDSQLHIGSFIFKPDNTVSIYTKQFLHDGEELFFSPGFDYNPMVEIENERISFAICADITNPTHPENAARNKSTLYLASIFYTPNGIQEGHQQLSSYAKKHTLKILMANFGGPSYNFEAGGQSAYWNNDGELLAKVEDPSEEMLFVEI
jgi:predicted amidohydrolase